RRSMAASPLAGVAGRAFAQGVYYPIRLAAKDVALAKADLTLFGTVYEQLTAYPEIADQDLAKIVERQRNVFRSGE
ncbi:hypothetical protein ACFQ1S_39735, partial [Kibdelosporangium lantanae]